MNQSALTGAEQEMLECGQHEEIVFRVHGVPRLVDLVWFMVYYRVIRLFFQEIQLCRNSISVKSKVVFPPPLRGLL
ncbi:MAG: hypothetical protein WBM35_05565, partial [Candidatus Electrothrix sp.]